MRDQTGWKSPTVLRADPYNKPRDLPTLNRWLEKMRPSSPQWELVFDAAGFFYFTRAAHVMRADSFRWRMPNLIHTTYAEWMNKLDLHVRNEASRTGGQDVRA
jgi:hypothetical protein